MQTPKQFLNKSLNCTFGNFPEQKYLYIFLYFNGQTKKKNERKINLTTLVKKIGKVF